MERLFTAQLWWLYLLQTIISYRQSTAAPSSQNYDHTEVPSSHYHNHQPDAQHQEPSVLQPPRFHRDKRSDDDDDDDENGDDTVTWTGRGPARVGVAVWSGWHGSSLRIHSCIDESSCHEDEDKKTVHDSKDVEDVSIRQNHHHPKPPRAVKIQFPDHHKKASSSLNHKIPNDQRTSETTPGTHDNFSYQYCLDYRHNISRLENKSLPHQQINSFNSISKEKGLVMQVLNQHNAKIMMQKVFPLGEYWAHWSDFEWYLERINTGHLVVLSVSGYGCAGLRDAANKLAQLGSKFVTHLTTYAHWNWIFVKGGKTLSETVTLRGLVNNNLHVTVPLESQMPLNKYKDNVLEAARWIYCEGESGMGDLCNNESPAILPLKHASPLEAAESSVLKDIPVVVTAGNRHQYLYSTLTHLLTAQGVYPENILVILGDSTEATMQLLCLLQVKFVTIRTQGNGNRKLFRYYRNVYDYVARKYPKAPTAIFLDEDVQVSPDFFSYLSKTLWLLHEDPTIYCINGFSATGFTGFAHDPATVLRAQVQVEWGYAISMKFIIEALDKWPLNPDDTITLFYDEWLYKHVRGDRECVFPEVSRTYHFGMGVNTNAFIAENFFLPMPMVNQSNVPLHNLNGLILPKFNKDLEIRIRNATPLTGSPCSKDFIPSTTQPTDFVFYYSMERDAKGQRIFLNFFYSAKCLNAWALSEQGQHDLVLTVKTSLTTTIFLVGAPYSPYGYLCPTSIKPWHFDSLTDPEYDELLDTIKNFELGNYKIVNANMTSDVLMEILSD